MGRLVDTLSSLMTLSLSFDVYIVTERLLQCKPRVSREISASSNCATTAPGYDKRGELPRKLRTSLVSNSQFDDPAEARYCSSTLERRVIQKYMKSDSHSCIPSEVAEA